MAKRRRKHPGVVVFPSIIHFSDMKPFVRLVSVSSRTKRQLLVSPFHRFPARRNALMSMYAGAFSRIHIRLESITSVYLGTQQSVIGVVLNSQDKTKDTKGVSHFVAYIRSRHAQNERQGRACDPKERETHGNGLNLLERISSSTDMAASYWFSSKHVSTRLRKCMVNSFSAARLGAICVAVMARFARFLLANVSQECTESIEATRATVEKDDGGGTEPRRAGRAENARRIFVARASQTARQVTTSRRVGGCLPRALCGAERPLPVYP